MLIASYILLLFILDEWLSYFDLTIVDAKKPAFFSSTEAIRPIEVTASEGLAKPHQVFSGGNHALGEFLWVLHMNYRGPIFRRFHGMPWPPNGSLNVSGSCLTILRCLDYLNIDTVYLYSKQESKLSLRLPFGGHGIPWKRLKIRPQEQFSISLYFM